MELHHRKILIKKAEKRTFLYLKQKKTCLLNKFPSVLVNSTCFTSTSASSSAVNWHFRAELHVCSFWMWCWWHLPGVTRDLKVLKCWRSVNISPSFITGHKNTSRQQACFLTPRKISKHQNIPKKWNWQWKRSFRRRQTVRYLDIGIAFTLWRQL